MSKPSVRKQKKQKARERTNAKSVENARDRKRYRQNFPRFILENEDNAAPGFVKLVKKAASQIDFRNKAHFDKTETNIFREMGRAGIEFTAPFLDFLHQQPRFELEFHLKVGTVLLAQIPFEKLTTYVPYNSVMTFFDGRDIVLKFRSLRQQWSPNGMIYFSKHQPKIDVDGVNRVIGFSRHAIERICYRIVPHWRTYAGLTEVFQFLEQCLQFERVDLHNGQLAFSFFGQYANGEPIVDEIVDRCGEDINNFYLRIGYCPAVLEGGFIKAKTLLLPGFKGTPELSAIYRAQLGWHEQQNLVRAADEIDINEIRTTADYRLLKWFHHHGVPQVIRAENQIYAKVS